MNRNIGIKDVAVAAGVSVTTVSHVLNEVAYARVSPETKDKVRSAAEHLGYGPNRLAQALRTQRTGMLGLVSEDIATTPHAGRIILGADEAAKARGYSLMIINTSGAASLTSRKADVEALLERRVDGILYATMYHRTVDLPDNLATVPSVLVDSVATGGNITAVIPDEDGGARAAVGVLLEAGHTRIGFLNNWTRQGSTAARRRWSTPCPRCRAATRRPCGSCPAETAPPCPQHCSATTTGWPSAPTVPLPNWA
jgi:LacI family transcriptional regulator